MSNNQPNPAQSQPTPSQPTQSQPAQSQPAQSPSPQSPSAQSQPAQSQPARTAPQPPQASQVPQAPQPTFPQQQSYQQQQQQQPYQQSYAAQRPAVAPSRATTLGQTNTFAFISIIMAFLSPLAAIVFGHMALSQIKRTGDAGRGIALTGLIIGYVYIVSVILFIVLYVAVLGIMFASIGAAASEISSYS